MKSKFFVTFGQKYRHEKHPSGLNINPNGYVVIHAYSYKEASQIAFDKFGSAFCMLYDEDKFESHFFPAGSLLELGNEETSNV